MRKKFLFRLILLMLGFCSCQGENPIPDYPVNLKFNITIDAPELAAFGGYKEFTVPANATQRLGYGGVLVYHSIEDKYFAFDLSCPTEHSPTTRVRCNNLGIATCDSCHTTYYVADGNGFVQSGEGRHALKKYSVYVDASLGNIIVVN